MKIHYISHHSILEYYEVSLLTELGHEVFSNGAYTDPKGHPQLPRPAIDGAPFYPEYQKLAMENPKTALPQGLIDPFDAFIFMHNPEALIENWPRIKHKPVVYRSIGQSTPEKERMLKPLRDNGLKVIRYSPYEANIPDWCGADAIIRFYVDKNEYQGWSGGVKRVINFTQSLKARGNNCYFDIVMRVMSGFDAKVFGPGNDDLGSLNGGNMPYELMKGQLRDNRVFLYCGTWPASYTLSFIEALMTGMPIVSMTQRLADLPGIQSWAHYEIPAILKNGDSGFIANSVDEMRAYITEILNDDNLAKKISNGGRRKAIELFEKQPIKSEWASFLKKL